MLMSSVLRLGLMVSRWGLLIMLLRVVGRLFRFI